MEGAREYGFARLVVRALFEDKYRMVQAAAACNPLLPSDLAEALLSCGIEEVEGAAARNPGLSTSLLSQLTKSDREHVRAGALANVSTAQSDMAEAALGEKMGEKVVDDAAAVIVAGNENVDVATAYVIADSGSAEARRILAGNEGNGLYSALYLVASCRDDVVARRACAANPIMLFVARLLRTLFAVACEWRVRVGVVSDRRFSVRRYYLRVYVKAHWRRKVCALVS